MRNLKKVLALVVAVAMIASMGLVASAANYSDVASNASYADAVNLLSNLGIITGYEDGTFKPDNTVTRAEAATMIVRMLNLDDEVELGETNFTDVAADNWASGYVNVAEANGVINGMGDGTFNPNGEVTYGQIVKMIVCALGYEPVALAHGGYLGGGYLYAGSSQVTGFTKGVAGTANAAASRATVARLIYNALEVELMDQTSFSTGINGSTYEKLENTTILSEYLGLEKVDGVITETYLSDATYEEGNNKVQLVITKNYTKVEKDEVPEYEVDTDDFYVAEGTDAATLLGYTVTAYLGENEEGDDAIFAVAPKAGKNNVVTLDTDLIVEDEFTADAIKYYKSESAKSTTEAEIQAFVGKKAETGIAVNNNVVVNGFNANYNVDIFDVEDGSAVWTKLDELTFLDNDNDGEFEFIFATMPVAAEEFVVATIDNEDDLWVFTNEDEDADFDIDYEDEEKLYTVVKDGKIVEANAIAEGDVITVLDTNVPVITVYVSSVSVEGVVDEVYDDVYTINGKDYELSPITMAGEELEAGTEGIFYINASGKIAVIDKVNTINTADYVYVTAVDEDTNPDLFTDESAYYVQVVTATGAVEVIKIKSKKVDVYTNVETEDVDDDVAFSLISAEMTDEGVLARIDTTANGELSAIYFAGAEDFVAVDRYENDVEAEKPASYNEARATYGVVDLSADTLIFNISDDDDEDLVDRVTVSTVGKSFADETTYSFVAYGAADEVADVLVVTAGDVSVDAEAPVMVVTKVSAVEIEDEPTIKITGIMAGEKVSVIVDVEEYEDNDAVLDTIVKGNVILFAEAGEYVEDVQVLYDSTEDGLGNVIAGGDIIDTKSDEDVSIHVGEITEKKAKYVVLGEDAEEGKFYFADTVNVTVVDYLGASVSITAGDLGDLKTSTKYTKTAFVKTALEVEDEITDVVVFVEAK